MESRGQAPEDQDILKAPPFLSSLCPGQRRGVGLLELRKWLHDLPKQAVQLARPGVLAFLLLLQALLDNLQARRLHVLLHCQMVQDFTMALFQPLDGLTDSSFLRLHDGLGLVVQHRPQRFDIHCQVTAPRRRWPIRFPRSPHAWAAVSRHGSSMSSSELA